VNQGLNILQEGNTPVRNMRGSLLDRTNKISEEIVDLLVHVGTPIIMDTISGASPYPGKPLMQKRRLVKKNFNINAEINNPLATNMLELP
jgi:hypothetical protein